MMRKFKRGFAITIAMVMSLSMITGCGDKNETTGTLEETATSGDAVAGGSSIDTTGMTIDEYIDAYAAGVTLGAYTGIEYEYDPAEASDEDVQNEVQDFIDSCETYEEDYDSEAKDGDIVNIDFVGTVDGVEFDGGNTEGSGYDLTLGSGSFIDDFEEQIEGHKPGETFDVNVTFPDDYGNEDLNGKDAVFATTLNYIKIAKEAEYTDELVAANTDYSNIEDYEASVRDEINATNESQALVSAQNLIMTTAITNATVENIPEDEVTETADQIITQLQSTAESYGIDYLTYITYFYGYSDEDSFAEYVTQVCEESVKEKMVVCAIAKAEGIVVDSDEVDAYVNETAEANGTTAEQLEASYSSEDLMYYALADKVMDFLMENGVKTESTETATEE
jgi:trigger factor